MVVPVIPVDPAVLVFFPVAAVVPNVVIPMQ